MCGDRKTGSQLLKVVVLGDYGVGKTCIMNRFVEKTFSPTHLPTIGVSFLTKGVMVHHDRYRMQIWDTSGQERYKSMRKSFYRGTDCLMLVFSLDDRRSFQNLTDWLDEFFRYALASRSSSFPLVVVGNKADLEDRAVTREEAEQWCSVNGGVPYFETSAKDGINVDEAFVAVLRRFRQVERDIEPRGTAAGSVQLEQAGRVTKSCF